jgi:hypothetical protein
MSKIDLARRAVKQGVEQLKAQVAPGKIGRNDPCYCGSGKKYKQCHMAADRAVEQEQREQAEAARFLRRDFLSFARDERFHEPLAAALPLYWNDYYELTTADEMSQSESFRFFDWFVFDYQAGDQPRLIETYRQERYDDLTAAQQQMLDAWLEAPPAAAYYLDSYEGQTLRLRDFISGQKHEVFEPGGHGDVQPGDIILARLVPVAGRLEFSVAAAYLPQDEIGDLAEKVDAARQADAEQQPGATDEAFLRRHNTLFIHHALEEAAKKERPPVARLDPHRSDGLGRGAAQQLKKLALRGAGITPPAVKSHSQPIHDKSQAQKKI